MAWFIIILNYENGDKVLVKVCHVKLFQTKDFEVCRKYVGQSSVQHEKNKTYEENLAKWI